MPLQEKKYLMVVNGEIISETKLNVDEMYSNGIMKMIIIDMKLNLY